jgi:hypothetical protein
MRTTERGRGSRRRRLSPSDWAVRRTTSLCPFNARGVAVEVLGQRRGEMAVDGRCRCVVKGADALNACNAVSTCITYARTCGLTTR